MPRGRLWTSVESSHLCEAWLFATNDPITGLDQSGARFWRTLADKFICLSPRNEDSRGRYIARLTVSDSGVCQYEMKVIKKQFELVSKDVQKFGIAIRRVHASNPTGSVTPTQIHAMACAIHIDRTDRMDYRFKDDIPREQCSHYDSFVVLQTSPKFSVTGTAGENTRVIDGSRSGGFSGGAEKRTESGAQNTNKVESDMFQEDGVTRGGSGPGGSGGNELRSAEGGGSSANSGNVERGGAGLDEEGGKLQEAEGEGAIAMFAPQLGARQLRMQSRSSYSSSSVLR